MYKLEKKSKWNYKINVNGKIEQSQKLSVTQGFGSDMVLKENS